MFGRGVAVTKLSLAVRKDAPSLFSYKKNRKVRGEKRALTLLALNPHRVSRDQPSCCRQFRRNGPGLGYRP